MARVTRITTGFLTGNLFDALGYDEIASAEKYKDALQSALKAAYPGVEVEVRYQRASGSLPYPLKTAVDFDTGDLDYREEEREIEFINHLAQQVYENFEAWVGEEETEETD